MTTVLGAEWERLGLTDLEGRTVLAVEASDGAFSLEARRRGAARVAAHDLDEFLSLDPVEVGKFDVVLFLDVFCRLQDPLDGLRRLAALTRDLAVIATPAVAIPGSELEPLLRFAHDGAFPVGSPSWWLPTEHGLGHVCHAAGFGRIETVHESEAEIGFGARPIGLRRLVVWACPK